MPTRWIPVLATLLALAAPATAPAALRIGIAENQPDVFSDPLFQDLDAKYVRVVVVLQRDVERRSTSCSA